MSVNEIQDITYTTSHEPDDCYEYHDVVVDFKEGPLPEIVVLCGSTRFMGAYSKANSELTLQGYVVLSVGVFNPLEEDKEHLFQLHLRKIDLADRVHILNVDGYIGEGTQAKIDYAVEAGKEITYLEVPNEQN